MADKGVAQRRLEEQIAILFGARGQDTDRAVRLSELSNMSSAAMAPIIAAVTAQAQHVVTAQVTQVDGSIRNVVAAARRAADQAADRVAAVDTKINDVNTRVDATIATVAADFDAVVDQISTLNDQVNADISGINDDVSGINADINARFGSVTDRLDDAFPRITDIGRQLDDASSLLMENAANLALLGKKVSDAGIHVDPETGKVEIYALKATDERVGAVSISLDAIEASINLKATFAYVNDAISNALLDPTQIPIISDFQLTLNQVLIDMNAVEASLALKAESLTVSGMAVTLGQVSVDLNAVESSLSLKASKSEFDNAVARLNAAEIQIDALDGIQLRADSYFGRFRDSEDFEYETLASLLNGLNAREELSGAFAGAMRQIRADTRDGLQAEAQDRLSLRADYDASTAALYVENNARANGIEAVSTQVTGLVARLDNVEGDYTSLAYVTTTFYARAQVDSAISAVQTSLSASINGVSSNLTTNYYTKAATDSAIGAVQTSLSASINGVSSNLATNYLTSADTTSAISAVQSNLTSSINGVQNNLANFQSSVATTYATQVDTNSALAGLETSFRAEMNRSTPPTGFVSGGDHWTSAKTGTPEAVGAPHASWAFASETASQSIPTSTTGQMLATRGAVPVADEDSIRITLIAQVTGGGPGINGVDFIFTWLDAAHSNTGIAGSVVAVNLAPGGYVSITATATAPPDAFWCRAGVKFDGTSYSPGASVAIRAIKVENLASLAEIQAGITNNFYTKVQTDSAIAAGISSYDASIEGGIVANVTQSAVAMADLNGSVARFSALVSAGDSYNAAGIQLLAWDSDGSTGSAVKLLGDNVIIPGTLSASSLVVTDGSGELVPNWNFVLGDLRGWTQDTGSALSVVAKASGFDGLSTANASFALRVTAGGGLNRIASEKISAKPGDRIAFSAEVVSGGEVTGADAAYRIRFFNKDNGLLGSKVALASPNSTTWATFGDVAIAPANTVYFKVRFDLTPSATQPIYAVNISAVRQRSGATLITPNSITTEQLNVTELSAITANIGLLRSATSGERVEISNDTIKVFDAAGTLRVLIGDLT